MIIDEERKAILMESRDINYILSSYIKLYMFGNKNETPEKIVFPMFRSVPHPHEPGVTVPVEYVPDDSPIAVEIKHDGSNIPETTPESEAKADDKEDEYKAMKAKIAELEEEVNKATPGINDQVQVEIKEVTPSKPGLDNAKKKKKTETLSVPPPSAERLAAVKGPEKPAPEGSQSDYGGRRDARDQQRIARDLRPEKEIKEEDEKEDDDLVEKVKGNKN